MITNMLKHNRLENPLEWSDTLKDKRSKKVVFLAHCLLNENTRYLGGACHQGAISEIVKPLLEDGIGIIQLPCPEQYAWGGVLKKKLLLFYNSKNKLRFKLRKILLPLAIWYTKKIYRKLAKQAVSLIQDYQDSGMTILGVVGVDASPSCGVCKKLDMNQAITDLGMISIKTATVEDINSIVKNNTIQGQGLYITLIQDELNKRKINIPFFSHDLIGELEGKATSVDIISIVKE